MKYTVTVERTEHDVEVIGEGVRVNGKLLTARLEAIPQTPLRRLVLNGAARTYAMIDSGNGWEVLSGGRIRSVSIEDERMQQLRSAVGAGDRYDHGGIVKAPMPGLVMRVEVKVGQQVEPGAGVVVLEAMKMENEIRAGSAGIVSSIRVEPGQTVEKGSVLVELEPRQA